MRLFVALTMLTIFLMNTKAPDEKLDNNPDKNMAVIIGVGQYMADVPADVSGAQGPVHIAAQAVSAALENTGFTAMAEHIDTVFCVRTFGDSGPMFACPFETSKNMPAAVARAVGINAKRHVYDVIGGNTPQSRIAEAAEEIEAGASKAVLICGAEAIANMRAAMRADVVLDWSDDADSAGLEDRGYFAKSSPPLMTRAAMAHSPITPIQYYTLLENARRAKQGLTREHYREGLSKIMEGLLQTSKDNALSVFSDVDANLNSLTRSNALFTDLYSKAILPKDGVNQGAAVIMTSYGHAVQLGLDPRKFIYLHAHVEGSEAPVLQRPELDTSKVLRACIAQAVNAANITAKDIGLRDLYSCFPIVLKESAAALGLNLQEDDLTLTGGLAFFGGPGNNYSLHGIAQMVEGLRAAPKTYGLVHANGGFMSKHAVGIYSAKPAEFPARIMRHMAEDGLRLEMAETGQGEAVIESFCVDYRKGTPSGAIMIGRLKDSGARVYANPLAEEKLALLDWLIADDPFGETVQLTTDGRRNYFSR